MSSKTICLSLIFITLGYSEKMIAQLNFDSTFYNNAYSNATGAYTASLKGQFAYWNGPVYPKYPFHISEGHPYFGTNEPTPGSLVYYGMFYENVKLMYDEITDELITEDILHRNLIQLYKNRITSFTIGRSRFIFSGNDSTTNNIKPGFYQILYDGNTLALKKEIKTIQEKANPVSAVERVIESRTYYYIRINNKYYRITNQGSLLSNFNEHKKTVRNYLKTNGINFRKQPDEAIRSAVEYYDQLTK